MAATVTLPELNVREELEKNRNNPGYVGKRVYEANSYEGVASELGLHTRKNLIQNGDFNVWQRGTSFGPTTGSEFTADRWLSNPSGGTLAISRQSFTRGQEEVPGNPLYYMRMTSSVADDNMGILQRMEELDRFSNTMVTVSFWARIVSGTPETIRVALGQIFDGGSTNIEISEDSALTPEWSKVSFSLYSESLKGKTTGSIPRFRVVIVIPDNATFEVDIARVQVEYGNQATEFEELHPATELALLQRYYQKSYDVDVDPGTITTNGSIIELATRNAAGFSHGVVFPTPMRIVPTVTIYSASTGASGKITNNGDKTSTASYIGKSGFGYVSTVTGDTASSATYHYTASADL